MAKKKKTQNPGNNPNVYLTGEWFSKFHHIPHDGILQMEKNKMKN